MECLEQGDAGKGAGSRRGLQANRDVDATAAEAIARAAALVEEQRQRVERLWAAGHDPTQAQRLLNLMLDALDVMVRRRRISAAFEKATTRR